MTDQFIISKVAQPAVRLLQFILPVNPFLLARATLLAGAGSCMILFIVRLPSSIEHMLDFTSEEVALFAVTFMYACGLVLSTMIEIDRADKEQIEASDSVSRLFWDRGRVWYAGISLIGLHALASDDTLLLRMFAPIMATTVAVYPAKCLAACKSYPNNDWGVHLACLFALLFYIGVICSLLYKFGWF